MVLAIQAEGVSYTKSDLRIMEYIENHTDEFLLMSIGQLAAELQMSEATVSRFVRHIGYGDFKELKAKVARESSGRGAARKLAGTFLKNEGFHLQEWFAAQQECLERTFAHTDPKEFERAARVVKDAKHILIHAKNASASIGQLLFFRLRRLGLHVSLVPSGGSEVLEGIAHAGKGDLVITFGFEKLSEESRMILSCAKVAGYQTMAFSSRLHAPAGERADISLYVYRGREEEYHSMTAAAAVADALVLAVSEQLEEASAKSLIRIQKLKEAYRKKEL